MIVGVLSEFENGGDDPDDDAKERHGRSHRHKQCFGNFLDGGGNGIIGGEIFARVDVVDLSGFSRGEGGKKQKENKEGAA